MIRKKGIIKRSLAMVTGLLCAGVFSVSAGEIPATLDINLQASCPAISGLPKDKKMVKDFSHKAHAEKYLLGNEKYSPVPYTDEFTCVACHAGAKDANSITKDLVCQGFETAFEQEGGAKKFQNHFHKTCKACHKAMKKDGKATGPVSCKGCHKK